MASPNNHIKIHEECKVAPHSSTQLSLPLTFFDLIWLRFHPVERIFFYTLQNSQSHPTFFFQNLVPKLKSSLSLTLQHFLPLAGNIVWPSDSPKPFIQFNPNDGGVSLLLAQCDDDDIDFNKILEHNSSHEASLSRSFVPDLESTDSFASIISIQITLFPKSGFSIGISTHHAVLDGKSSTMFVKAWASICKSLEETNSPNLEPFLEPILEREVIKDPKDLENVFINTKAIQQSESDKKQKFSFGFPVDCRDRLDHPIPENYFGNCVSNHIVDTEPEDFTKEDGVVIVAKKIYGKIKNMDKGVLDGLDTLIYKLMAMIGEGIKGMGVAGSTKFGVYEIDFGFGRPEKVEITSIDRGLTIGLTESKDLKGGVEVGLVLNKHVMDLFHTIFHEGICFDS
ncbi:hypothetical protein P8452_58872 [Trifolium repens]|nr:hypothetical protein P8452_58872 [Trifolium repens]